MSTLKNKRIRVCHIITRLDAGGAAENTLRTVCSLDPALYEVSLLYGRTHSPLTEWMRQAEESGVALYSLPRMFREIRPLADLRVFGQLFRLLGRLTPHIVHTHSSKAGILGRWAARLRGVPILVHTPHGHVFYGYYGAFFSWVFRTTEKVTAWFTDRMVTLTDVEIQHHLEAKVGRRDQFVTIHSGVDVDKFGGARVDRDALRKQLRVPPGGVCIGSAGRLVAVKNYSLLLEALAVLHAKRPDHYHLVILGEGAERGILLQKGLDLGVQDRFYLPGWFPDIENYYPAFDLFVLPSRNEGMGRVLVEAMAAGVPIVATAVGGVPELLSQGDCGVLVAPDDPEALAGAIEKVAGDPQRRQRLTGKAKDRTRSYTVERMIEKIHWMYEQLLTQKGIKPA